MTSEEIEAFLKVYQTGNMTQAASELFITQSSLSTKIKKLEEDLGMTLFTRGKGRKDVTPTYQGEKFYRLALRYMSLEDQMYNMSQDSFQEKLKITAPNSIGTYMMTKVYDKFMKQYPNVFLEIRDQGSKASALHLEIDDVDLAFTAEHIRTPGMASYGVLNDPMVFVCNSQSDYPEIVHSYDLKPENEIYVDWTAEFDWWHQHHFGWTPRISLSIMSNLEYFLDSPDRWSIVPSSVAHHLTRDGRIIECDMAFEAPSRKTDCLYPRSTRKEKLIFAFLACMRESIVENEDTRIHFK